MALQLDRSLQASEPAQAPHLSPSLAGNGPEPEAASNGTHRYPAFRQVLDSRGDKGRPYIADAHQMTGRWEAEAGAFAEESYWVDKQMPHAGLKSVLTLLRLFVGQVA